MPNSIIVASGHDNYLRYFKYTPQMSNVSIKTIEGHSAWIRSLASYGNFLASGSDDSALKIWKLSSTNILEQVHLVNSLEKMKAYYWSLIFINAGVIVAGRGQNDNYSIRLWDFEKYDKPKIILGHRNIVRSLIVIEEKVLVSISDDGSIKFWCLETFSLKKTILAHRKQINCIVHNKKKRLLATAGSDFLIKIWVTHGFYQSLLVFSQPDKILVLGSIDKLRLLITGSIYGFIKLWDWVDGSLKCNASVGMEIHSLLCKEEDETIFSGDSSGKITVWRVSSL